ncbi:spermidine synthase [Streptomyces sp. HPF1205]|uniref:spermidine synthase n=1 Tax=Streptomyces sp. HPF1205 TaxID=2873262 RepID=UPI001CEDD93D|nr:fused MFS/spermidine synthase [Streptomyces sp. HPF1205]
MTHEPVPVTRPVDFGTAKLLPDVDRPRAWLLTVDGAPQSYVDLDRPEHLEFEYARRIAVVLESVFDAPFDAVHLGGGGMALPRRLGRVRPGSRQRVVEADRELARLVAELLPLDDQGVTVDVADAREWVAAAPEASADAVVVDVFGGSRVPAHLTSVEFVTRVREVLRPDGLYVANLADSAPFAFLGHHLGTVRAVFGPAADLCLLAEPGVLRGRRFGNVVVAAAAGRPLPLDAITRACAADAFPARVVAGDDLDRLTGAPVYDACAEPSPEPPEGAFTVG